VTRLQESEAISLDFQQTFKKMFGDRDSNASISHPDLTLSSRAPILEVVACSAIFACKARERLNYGDRDSLV
jgi:hypothetical protein